MPKGSELLSPASFRRRLLAVLVVTQMGHRPQSGRAAGIPPPLPFAAQIPATCSPETEQAPVTILGVAKEAPAGLAVTHTHTTTPKGHCFSPHGGEASTPTASCPSSVSLSWSGEHQSTSCALSLEHPQEPCLHQKCSCARRARNIILAWVTVCRMAW